MSTRFILPSLLVPLLDLLEIKKGVLGIAEVWGGKLLVAMYLLPAIRSNVPVYVSLGVIAT